MIKQHGQIVGEEYAEDVRIKLQACTEPCRSVRQEAFESFQSDMRELSSGKIQVQIIESKEEIVAV